MHVNRQHQAPTRPLATLPRTAGEGKSTCARRAPSLLPAPYPLPPSSGFTLIELIVAMSISVVVVAFMAMFITGPVNAYQAQSRRAELVDATDSVVRLMARDIRRALPNSVRVASSGNVFALEVLETVDAARYVNTGTSSSPERELDFSAPDNAFATLGELEIPADLGTARYYLSIYNVGVAGANAYELSNVITPSTTNIGISNPGAGESLLTLTPAFRFAYGSPANRVFLVRGPVTYLCNTTSRTLRRYAGYSIASSQMLSDAALLSAGATRGHVADDVAACAFEYSSGTAERAGLVTIDVTLARAASGGEIERVRLLQQVHVENTP